MEFELQWKLSEALEIPSLLRLPSCPGHWHEVLSVVQIVAGLAAALFPLQICVTWAPCLDSKAKRQPLFFPNA